MILYTKRPNGIEEWETIQRLRIDGDLVYVDNSSRMDALRLEDYTFIHLKTDTNNMIWVIKRMMVEMQRKHLSHGSP